MATKGQCNPAPEQFNEQTLALDNGRVRITTLYGWDGVSVYPDCLGPIESVRIQNGSARDWYVMVPLSRRGNITFRAVPGADKTYAGTQLALLGLQTNTDLSELNWSSTRPAGTVIDLP